MITLRRARDRGHADHGWLRSWHSFSFADYHDPAHMGVGNLRVLNDDRIAPGTGFGTHGHRDMEIVSVVLEGALAHRDSMGTGGGVAGGASSGAADGVIRPGDVQRMSAGTGVMHSEFNHADTTTHFLQIWLLPRERGIRPGYEQKHFAPAARRGRLVPIVAPDGADGALHVNADAVIRAGLFDGDERAELALDPQRLTYVHLARGALRVNDRALAAGDALTLDGETALVLEGGQDAEVLVFDLARLR
jgi:redox-sensitive bicupin YhaK (pirin superfamily)